MRENKDRGRGGGNCARSVRGAEEHAVSRFRARKELTWRGNHGKERPGEGKEGRSGSGQRGSRGRGIPRVGKDGTSEEGRTRSFVEVVAHAWDVEEATRGGESYALGLVGGHAHHARTKDRTRAGDVVRGEEVRARRTPRGRW